MSRKFCSQPAYPELLQVMRRPVGVVLLAGPSGSGKSYIARRTGLPVLCLDDFYKNGDDPTLPYRAGAVDWDSPQAWDSVAAVETIARLVQYGKAEVPVYAIGADRRVDSRTLDLAGSPVFIAEGIFAAEILPECRRRGLVAEAYALRRPRGLTFLRRLLRDLAERRKKPGVLIRRGLALLRAEPRILRRQTSLGCRPARASEVVRQVAALVTDLPGQPERADQPARTDRPDGPGHPSGLGHPSREECPTLPEQSG
jgi:uridine kinase